MHETSSVKVNAYVDKGITPIVEALSLRHEIITVDSCQGGEDRGIDDIGRDAYVYFVSDEPSDFLEKYVVRLSEAINGYAKVSMCSGSSSPMAIITIESNKGKIYKASMVIRKFVKNWTHHR